MSKSRKIIGAAAATVIMAGVGVAGVSGSAVASAANGYEPLAGSLAPFVAGARALGAVSGSVPLTVQVWLRPNLPAAEHYAEEVSTPGTALFHHYLSPDAYTRAFAATARQAGAVETWLRQEGFRSVGTDSQRNYVRATATTARIDAAFRVTLTDYARNGSVNAGGYVLRSNDRPVSIPASLATSVLGVSGLDNAAPITPLDRPTTTARASTAEVAPRKLTTPCSQYYGQHTVSGLPKQFGTTTFPTVVCGYTAGQMRAAYGANTTNTGKGQTIALVELGLTQDMFLTLQDYAAAQHMPAPSAQRYTELSLGNGTACGDAFNVEEQLDVESSYDMAPAADQLVVGGDSCNNGDFGLQGLFDADIAVLDGVDNHPYASVASNSWESGDEGQPGFLTNIEHSYLTRAVGEGVGMYFSAGDGSGVEMPSSDPLAISVGGTTLGIGSKNNRLFETGWSTALSLLEPHAWSLAGEQGASGGGPSILWAQPKYQRKAVPVSLSKAPGNRGGAVRSAPDISADADPYSGFLEGALEFPNPNEPPKYTQFDIGGTSLAAPLVAGIVTAAQQGQPHAFGFIDPAIYKLAGSKAFNDALPLGASSPASYHGTVCDAATCGAALLTTFDDQSYSMNGYTGQVTLKGYDNMTGLGTPAGQAFIDAL
ncbi:MAG TPA: protease pro-enzyme activation domain-containing protein, partial [Acidimicrobiales bacterium]|nr:protease pro-enzyme activation domain-containing protein [Acidimicrobiales bacterium]